MDHSEEHLIKKEKTYHETETARSHNTETDMKRLKGLTGRDYKIAMLTAFGK